MKSLTKILLIFALSTQVLFAQSSFFMGTNAGFNFSKFKYTEDLAELYPSTNALTGLNAGVSLGFQIENITITSGLMYMQKGGNYETENFTDQVGTGFFSADERLHYLSIPLHVGYRQRIGSGFGVSVAMGPSFNFGLNGKINESIEYYGSEDISTEKFAVEFGSSVNEDYRSMQVGFQFSPGIFIELNDRSTVTMNVVWDKGLNDSYNDRYKQANTFFDNNKGKQLNRSAMITIGYEYHISFDDKY